MRLVPTRIDDLDDETRGTLMRRSMDDISSVYDDMRRIVDGVKAGGDEYMLEDCPELTGITDASLLEVTGDEIEHAYRDLSPDVVESLRKAARNITRFHTAQLEREMWSIEVKDGVLAGRLVRPMDRVGCYIPGGRAVYPSSILMTVIPAKAAGVRDIIAVTPPRPGLVVPPATLVAADIAGCDRIFKVGGPWAVAALAFGTSTVPRVDKIVGPGNRYVTAAKMIVYGQVDIDSPAGPSEALILADDTGIPEFIAADFLAQTEHDPDSAAVLVTTSKELAEAVCHTIEHGFDRLPRREILESSVARNSHVLVAGDMDQAVDFTNEYAPEHLQIMTRDPFLVLTRIRHAGSIFLGPYAPVPAGDYASGTNHVLPTGGCARMFSGLSVDDFITKPTFQYLSKKGLEGLKDTVVTLAGEEGLPLHARAVQVRFE